MLFFLAGLNTVSGANSFMAYELAVNPNVQTKLYEEICDVCEQLNGKKLTYEALQEMNYMDCVVSETLRRWTLLATQDRVVNKACVLVDKKGKKIQLNVGDGVIFPAGAIHTDAKYYSNPKTFDPDRFNNDNKHKIRPGTYLPFGIGPRSCVNAIEHLFCVFFLSCEKVISFSFSDCVSVCDNGNEVAVFLLGQKFCH